MTSAGATDQAPGYGSYRYRTYVLGALTLIYVLNFNDRGLLAVVGPDSCPIWVFPTLNSAYRRFWVCPSLHHCGHSLSQYADTGHRVWLMSVCITFGQL